MGFLLLLGMTENTFYYWTGGGGGVDSSYSIWTLTDTEDAEEEHGKFMLVAANYSLFERAQTGNNNNPKKNNLERTKSKNIHIDREYQSKYCSKEECSKNFPFCLY